VGKQNRIALTRRGDAHVVFGVRRVREERFNDEVVESTSDGFNLDKRLASVKCKEEIDTRCDEIDSKEQEDI
jgi:hypothetical protein